MYLRICLIPFSTIMRSRRICLLKLFLCLVVLFLAYHVFYLPEQNSFHGITLRNRTRLPINPKLVDLNDFKFIRNNEEICDGKSANDTLILILVHSGRDDFVYRKAIRESWGSVQEFGPDWKFKTVFLLGQPFPNSTDETVELHIEKETRAYGDIILGNFVDTYRNLSYKHLMGYKWVHHFCPEATVVIRADDDMFINVFKIKKFLQQYKNVTNSLLCIRMPVTAPIRGVHISGVTRAEYPSDVYPEYCSGCAYITRPTLIDKLLDASVHFKYFFIDDVFVTGMLRSYPDIPSPPIGLTDIGNRYKFLASNETEEQWKDYFIFGLVPRENVPSIIERLWIRTLKREISRSHRRTEKIVFRVT